jgi:uncharacterized delta-60 repeat protein
MKKTVYIFLSFVFIAIVHNSFSQSPGTLDSTFGIYGKVMTATSPLSLNDNLEDLLLQPDGKTIAVGWFTTSSSTNYSDLAMVRYKTTGSIDSSFGINGKVIYNLSMVGNHSDIIRSAFLQNDGKIICTGSVRDTSATQIVLARFLSNGTIDSTFGFNGISTLDIAPSSNDEGNSVLVQPDGKILVAALSSISDSGLVIRYRPNGMIDSTFGNNGILRIKHSVRDISLLSNGKILATGEYGLGLPVWWYFGVTRIDSTGNVDSTFGTNGFTYFDHTNIAGPTFWSYWVNTIDVQPDGKIIIGGGCRDKTIGIYDTRFAVGRLNSDGSMDSTFGTFGRAVIDFPENFERIHDVAIQPDGKIFLIGETQLVPTINSDIAIARINSNGTLDNTFNSTGKLQIDFIAGYSDYGYASILQSDGKLLVAGSSEITLGKYEFALVRLLNNLNLGIVDFHTNSPMAFFYPNPIEQNSTLEYSLKNSETVSISLFDVQGKRIKVFVDNQKQQKGDYQQLLEFPTDLAKGVYFIIMSSSEGQLNIKIVK